MNDHKPLSLGRFLASAVLCALALALAVVPAVVAPAEVFAVSDLSPAGGDLAQILDAAQRGFEALSATVVADALLAAPAGIQVEYVSDAGRIDFILECAPGATARTISVPPGEMRAAVDAELRIRRGPRLVAVPTPLP